MFWLRVVFAASDRVWQAKSSCKHDYVIWGDVRRNVHTLYIRQQGEAAKERNFRNTLIMLVGFKYLKLATWNTEEKIVLLLFVITIFMQISQLNESQKSWNIA